MSSEQYESTKSRFEFHFHVGFDLYVAVRCGNKEAFEELETLQHSDPLAAGYMAMSLTRSENAIIPKDICRARKLSKEFVPVINRIIRHSAQESHVADAYYILAMCYEEGYSVFKNFQEAVHCYKESSNMGHPGATVNLSNCYDSGKGVKADKKRVFELDRVAAELGHPIGINNLACCYFFGKGCDVNHSMKVKLWKQASHIMAYPMSQVNLGLTYFSGVGIEKDITKAVDYFRIAAKAGLTRAQLILAECYYRGEGVERSVKKAIEISRLAADSGCANAQYALGCYIFTTNENEAAELFKSSADGGNCDAQYLVGRFYLRGDLSFPKDVITASRYFRKACAQNHEYATTELQNIHDEYQASLWENRKAFWMFLSSCQFIKSAGGHVPSPDSTHAFFYITDLCIYLSTFL